MPLDYNAVQAEAARREERAKALGLPALVSEFYERYASRFPSSSDGQPDRVPSCITGVRHPAENQVEFECDGSSYLLLWSERSDTDDDGEPWYSASLNLAVDGARVLEIGLRGEHDRYTGVTWRPWSVDAFIEGPWIGSLTAIIDETKRLAEVETQRIVEKGQARHARELAERFGITAEDLAQPRASAEPPFPEPDWLKELGASIRLRTDEMPPTTGRRRTDETVLGPPDPRASSESPLGALVRRFFRVRRRK
jgi:hypothetical protein